MPGNFRHHAARRGILIPGKRARGHLEALFLAYVTREGRLYSRGGPRVGQRFDPITRSYAEHYDGVRTGGVDFVGFNCVEVPFQEGELDLPPIFRGTYGLHGEYGHFLRIDPPLDRAAYCAAKGIPEADYSSAVLNDYEGLLRVFDGTPAAQYRKRWTAHRSSSEPALPLDNLTGAPLLVIHDELRILFSEQGLTFPREVTLDRAVAIIDGALTIVPEEYATEPPAALAGRVSQNVRIASRHGLHMRVANKVVTAAATYPAAAATIGYRGTVVSAMQILKLMTLGPACGAEVTVSAAGESGPAALAAICAVLANDDG